MQKEKNNEEYFNFLFSSHRLGTVLGLERVTYLLNKLGNPQNSFKSIHIAGTNGKGSTVEIVSKILQEYGFKVGIYTSPHIKRFSERIRINGEEIPGKDLILEIKKIKEITEKKQKTDSSFLPTFFEFGVAIAYNYFARKKVGFAVIEAGLGGRLDATNVLNPKIAVITNVSREHVEYLGGTTEKIALEKVEIIKPKSVVVTGETSNKILKIIKNKAKKEKTEVFESQKLCKIKNYSFGLAKQKFDLEVEGKKIKGIEIPLLGKFQLKNVCTSVLAVKKLGLEFNVKKLKKGLKKVLIPARFEVIQKNPLIVFDAGHNPAGFKELKETLLLLKKKKLYQKLILFIGLSSDKDVEKISRIIFPLASKIIISKANYRGMEIERIAEFAGKHKKPFIGFHDPNEAFDFALNETGKKDLLLASGSIFFLGELNPELD